VNATGDVGQMTVVVLHYRRPPSPSRTDAISIRPSSFFDCRSAVRPAGVRALISIAGRRTAAVPAHAQVEGCWDASSWSLDGVISPCRSPHWPSQADHTECLEMGSLVGPATAGGDVAVRLTRKTMGPQGTARQTPADLLGRRNRGAQLLDGTHSTAVDLQASKSSETRVSAALADRDPRPWVASLSTI